MSVRWSVVERFASRAPDTLDCFVLASIDRVGVGLLHRDKMPGFPNSPCRDGCYWHFGCLAHRDPLRLALN